MRSLGGGATTVENGDVELAVRQRRAGGHLRDVQVFVEQERRFEVGIARGYDQNARAPPLGQERVGDVIGRQIVAAGRALDARGERAAGAGEILIVARQPLVRPELEPRHVDDHAVAGQLELDVGGSVV